MTMASLKQAVFVDDRLESYRGLFSDDWGPRSHEAARDAARLQRLVFDLLMQWRGAAYTAEFPATLIDHFSSFASGFIGERTPNTDILKLADALVARCSRDLPEVTADPVTQRRLRETFVRLGAQITDFADKTEFEFSRQQVWKQYLQEHVYQITIWSSLRICYVAIFNAYDNFIAQSTQIAAGDPSIRTTDRDFNKRFSTSFGEPMLQKCWVSNDMHIIRRVRHSLSHADGRETDQLKKVKHSVRIVGGKLQITPDDLRQEYVVLKQAALALIEHLSEWPQFK